MIVRQPYWIWQLRSSCGARKACSSFNYFQVPPKVPSCQISKSCPDLKGCLFSYQFLYCYLLIPEFFSIKDIKMDYFISIKHLKGKDNFCLQYDLIRISVNLFLTSFFKDRNYFVYILFVCYCTTSLNYNYQ